MKLCDHLVLLIKDILPDSQIANKMQMARTKCTGVIKNVLGQCCFNELTEELKERRFSVLIDESTDIGAVKNMCVCVRYFSSKLKRITTRFFSLVQCFSGKNSDEANTGATAEVIYNKLIEVFTSSRLPLDNIIGFGSDGCNTMFGSKNSVVTRLEHNFPGIVIQKCICHSLHLCASEACKVLPRHCEDLARDIFNFFKHSSKRQAQLLEFQEFCHIETHKILRPSQTRWLSLLMVVNRIVEQWEPLKLYFTQQWIGHRLLASETIANRLNDSETKLFFYFLQWILPKFVDLNAYFQNEQVVITTVYTKMCETFKFVLMTFLKPNYVHQTPLANIEPDNDVNFIDLKNIYLGIKVMENINKLNKHQQDDFFIRCRQFLIVSAKEIKKRFNFGDSILSKIAIFDKNYARQRPQSLLELMKMLFRIVSSDDIDKKQKIDDQWRLYCQCLNEFPDEIKNENNIDSYWYKISINKDLSGCIPFKDLGEFVLDILVLPHSNADCERVFSKVNLIKTDTRNSLCTKTINALLLSSQSCNGECYNFEVTRQMINAMSSKNVYKKDGEENVQVFFE